MATEALKISITESGARVVKVNIDAIGQSADKAYGQVLKLKKALASIPQLNLTGATGQVQNLTQAMRNLGTTTTSTNSQLNQFGNQGIGGVTVGSQRATQSLNTVGDAVDQLRAGLALLATGFAVEKVVQYSDEYTNLQNRLRTVTKDSEDLKNVTNELYRIANTTRQSFGSVAELYTRVSLAASNLGFKQKQLIDFTESLNKTVALSGATAQEATNALIQLAQGLGSGALRGDELRSVLEQLPAVADVIAKELGVSRNELRQLGKDGAITGRTVIDAFLHAKDAINEAFANSVPTIDQALTVLRNNFVRFIGETGTATGLSNLLAQSILLVANNMNILAPVIITITTLLAVGLAGQAIPLVITALRALAVATLSNPITAIPAIIIAAVGALYTLMEALGLTSTVMGALGQVASFIWGILTGIGTAVYNFLVPSFGALNALWQLLVVAGSSLWQALMGIYNVIGLFLAEALNLVNPLFTQLGNVFAAVYPYLPSMSQAFAVLVQAGIVPFALAIDGVIQVLNQMGLVSDETAKAAGDLTEKFLDFTSVLKTQATESGNAANGTDRLSRSFKDLLGNANGASSATDNATESVKEYGRFLGIETSQTITAAQYAKNLASIQIDVARTTDNASYSTDRYSDALSRAGAQAQSTASSYNQLAAAANNAASAASRASSTSSNYSGAGDRYKSKSSGGGLTISLFRNATDSEKYYLQSIQSKVQDALEKGLVSSSYAKQITDSVGRALQYGIGNPPRGLNVTYGPGTIVGGGGALGNQLNVNLEGILKGLTSKLDAYDKKQQAANVTTTTNTTAVHTNTSSINSLSSTFDRVGSSIKQSIQNVSTLIAQHDALDLARKNVSGLYTEKGVKPTSSAYDNLQGYKTGGSFRVGGQDGQDRNLVQFMASKGERVTIDKSTDNSSKDKTQVIQLGGIHFHGMKDAKEVRTNRAGIERTVMRAVKNAQNAGQQ